MNFIHHKATSLAILLSYIFVYVMPHQTFGQTDTLLGNTSNLPAEQNLQLINLSAPPLPENRNLDTLVLPDSLKATSAVPADSKDSNLQPQDSPEQPVHDTERTLGNSESHPGVTSEKTSNYYGNGFTGYQPAGRGVPTPGASSGKKRTLLVDTIRTDSTPPAPAPLKVVTDSSVSTPPLRLGTKGKIITAAIITVLIGGSIAAIYLKSQKETETEKKNRIPAPPLPPDN